MGCRHLIHTQTVVRRVCKDVHLQPTFHGIASQVQLLVDCSFLLLRLVLDNSAVWLPVPRPGSRCTAAAGLDRPVLHRSTSCPEIAVQRS